MKRLKGYKTPTAALDAYFESNSALAVHEWLGCTLAEWNEFQDPKAYKKAQRNVKKLATAFFGTASKERKRWQEVRKPASSKRAKTTKKTSSSTRKSKKSSRRRANG